MEGQHTIVAMAQDGMPVDAANFANLKGGSFRFTNDKLVGTNTNGNEFFNATYTIDSSKTPCTIDMKPTTGAFKDKELQGLIERKDNTINLIFALPGGERPTEFKTKENQVMYTLQAGK